MMVGGPDADSEDRLLVERWRRGEKEACAHLFARHQGAMRAFIKARTPHDTDDLAQRTFIAFLEARDRFRFDACVRTFLIAIAHRQICVDHRRDARDFSYLTLSAEMPASPLAQLTALESERRLASMVAALPAELCVVVLLHYWHEMGQAEIAGVLDIPTGTVASRLRRAREHLRAAFARIS
jgi:RNA polymerase sigma factor (sigma-70 family)